MAKSSTKSILASRVAYLRIAFGLMWAIDASFKWQSSFFSGFMDTINSAAQGQPGWLSPWFSFWHGLFGMNPGFFALLVALSESLIAVALIFGIAKRFTYLLAIVFSLMIWSIPEGFGGPYSSGSTDIGTGIIYAVVFFALYGLEQLAAVSRYSVDESIKRRYPWWHVFADPGQV